MEQARIHEYESSKDILFDDSVWHFIGLFGHRRAAAAAAAAAATVAAATVAAATVAAATTTAKQVSQQSTFQNY